MQATKLIAIDKNKDKDKFNGDLLVYCFPEVSADGGELTDIELTALNHDLSVYKEISNAYKLGDFTGKEGETFLFYPYDYTKNTSTAKDFPDTVKKEDLTVLAKRVLVVGIGKLTINNDNDLNLFLDILRKAGGSIAAVSAKIKAKNIMICLPDIEAITQNITLADIAQCLSEGVLLGDYRFLKYKKDKKNEPEYKGLSEVIFYCPKSLHTSPKSLHTSSKSLHTNSKSLHTSPKLFSTIRNSLKLAFTSAKAVCEARDMANEPGNGWRASDFASYATNLAKKYDLKCTLLDKNKMKELGMGGVLAVNQGSSEPPTMVILEYHPQENDPQENDPQENDPQENDSQIKSKNNKPIETILLVGKGITFDSGGLCLKQASGMENMKYDMSGGAAVIAVMQAVGQEKPKNVAVIAIVPATDNLSGSAAVKPGDVIVHYNKVTSEIVNTDAEGRMVLADALAYGIEQFKPTCVIDIATLTGAVIMGLGHHYSAILGNSDKLIQSLEKAAQRAGEPLWRLPLGKEYTKQIESKVADIKNTGGKSAGTITAAAYLQHFVGNTPWAHIDIAGTAWEFTEKSYIPKGASGIGVRTFLELIRNWKQNLTIQS